MTKEIKAELKAIGRRVRYWRKYYYASLPLAAKDAGVPKSIWSKVENGKSNYTFSTMFKINKALFNNLEL